MEVIDAENAEAYLRRVGWIAADARVEIDRLAGGISNEVLYVTALDGTSADFVVKQARPQLRTADPWYCSTERIWREVDVLRICGRLTACTPAILREDRANHLFAMTAAPREHRVWKSDLLAGQCDDSIASSCGQLLATIHAGTWDHADVARQLDDRTYFDLLRLDPYYRHVARTVPDAAGHFDRLVDSVLAHRHCLVHADFSPKNLLVWSDGMLMVDFETGHYGDPAFDLGFFLSHLTLKAHHFAPRHEPFVRLADVFLAEYAAVLKTRVGGDICAETIARGLQNLAGCAWARLDGKSKIEYLTDEARRQQVRSLCRDTLHDPPDNWTGFATELRGRLAKV